MKGGTTIISISLLRVLAMIFIVFYHCICFYGIWHSLDKNSLGIYILHHCLIWIVLLYVPGVKTLMCCYQYVAPFILFIAVFMASFALAYFMNTNHYTAQLIGLKRK